LPLAHGAYENPVQSLQVEFELSEVFGFKTANLEFEGYSTIESSMKEQQIERKISSTNL
jgi:hypothetical protein